MKSTKIHPERITKAGRRIVNDLDYEGIKFLVSKTDYQDGLQQKKRFSLMYFVIKMT